MSKLKEFDVVRMKSGYIATILEVFSNDVYLVEITDSSGKTLGIQTVVVNDVDKIVWKS